MVVYLGNGSKLWGKNKFFIADFSDIVSKNEKWGLELDLIGPLMILKISLARTNELLNLGCNGLLWT